MQQEQTTKNISIWNIPEVDISWPTWIFVVGTVLRGGSQSVMPDLIRYPANNALDPGSRPG
jgi:hypothetical protein